MLWCAGNFMQSRPDICLQKL